MAEKLKALADPLRLKMLQLLPHSEKCEHGSNVSTLAEILGLAQPTVSHHLKVLRQAGIVANKKMCRDVYYWVNGSEACNMLQELRGILKTRQNRSEDCSEQ